jgi:Flp pilus assembly pilin Flp
MTEYIIIVALIAIAAIGVVTTFGNDIIKIFNSSTEALAGQTSVANTSKSYGTKTNNLAKFGEQNAGK